MLTEEFLKPLSMSHDELAEAIGVASRILKILSVVLRRLTDDEARVLADIFGTDEDFWSNLQKLQDRKKRR